MLHGVAHFGPTCAAGKFCRTTFAALSLTPMHSLSEAQASEVSRLDSPLPCRLVCLEFWGEFWNFGGNFRKIPLMRV